MSDAPEKIIAMATRYGPSWSAVRGSWFGEEFKNVEYTRSDLVANLTAERDVYKKALEEIVDATPAHEHKKWPHHHRYLSVARNALEENPNE